MKWTLYYDFSCSYRGVDVDQINFQYIIRDITKDIEDYSKTISNLEDDPKLDEEFNKWLKNRYYTQALEEAAFKTVKEICDSALCDPILYEDYEV